MMSVFYALGRNFHFIHHSQRAAGIPQSSVHISVVSNSRSCFEVKKNKDHIVKHYDLQPYNFKPGDAPPTWRKAQ